MSKTVGWPKEINKMRKVGDIIGYKCAEPCDDCPGTGRAKIVYIGPDYFVLPYRLHHLNDDNSVVTDTGGRSGKPFYCCICEDWVRKAKPVRQGLDFHAQAERMKRNGYHN